MLLLPFKVKIELLKPPSRHVRSFQTLTQIHFLPFVPNMFPAHLRQKNYFIQLSSSCFRVATMALFRVLSTCHNVALPHTAVPTHCHDRGLWAFTFHKDTVPLETYIATTYPRKQWYNISRQPQRCRSTLLSSLISDRSLSTISVLSSGEDVCHMPCCGQCGVQQYSKMAWSTWRGSS